METKYTITQTIEDKIIDIINFIGDDPSREGLKDTPGRIIRSWKEIFKGYNENPLNVIKTFDEDIYQECVILKNSEFYSVCEHHFLPFFGIIGIVYIPNGKIIGVSKLVRLIDIYARRLQIQERLTCQIADAIMEYLNPRGVMVVCKATHLCMLMRGVKKSNACILTSAVKGIIKEDVKKQEMLYKLLE